MKYLPATVPDLIKKLDEMYPARCIGPKETIESAQRYAGSRDVIEYLTTSLSLEDQTPKKR